MEWVNPEKCEVQKAKGDILCKKFYHKMYPEGTDGVKNKGIVDVDGYEWEIFHVSKITSDRVWGMPMEGIGLINCMIMKEDTREFLPEELEQLSEFNMCMVGSHTGNVSQRWKQSVNPFNWEDYE